MRRTRTKRGRKVSSSKLHERRTSECGADSLKCVQVSVKFSKVDLHGFAHFDVDLCTWSGTSVGSLGCFAASCRTAIWDIG